MRLFRFVALICAVFLWSASAFAQTTAFTGSGTHRGFLGDNSSNSGKSIHSLITPAANSAGGTLSAIVGCGTNSGCTVTAVYACLATSTSSPNCNAAPVELLCTGPNAGSGGHGYTTPSGGAAVTCTSAANFPSYTTSSTVEVCQDQSSATGPGYNNASSVGTIVGYNVSTTSSNPCSTQSPGGSITAGLVFLASVVSNSPGTAAPCGLTAALTMTSRMECP